MSQVNSDFGEVVIDDPQSTEMSSEVVNQPPPPAYRKQGFSIYTVMLILSFCFCLAAAILFYINAETY